MPYYVSLFQPLTHLPLGWYIHTCSKMNYKRKFKPCYILCPGTSYHVHQSCSYRFLTCTLDTLVYVPYQEARPLMDEFGYTQLAVNVRVI